MNNLYQLTRLEELRTGAIDALTEAGFATDANNLRQDPAITTSCGWLSWTQSVNDASLSISREPRRSLGQEKRIAAATLALELLESAMAVFAQTLLSEAMQRECDAIAAE